MLGPNSLNVIFCFSKLSLHKNIIGNSGDLLVSGMPLVYRQV